MILYSKPTPWCEKSGYWSGRAVITVGDRPPKEEEKQEKEEFLKEEEFKV